MKKHYRYFTTDTSDYILAWYYSSRYRSGGDDNDIEGSKLTWRTLRHYLFSEIPSELLNSKKIQNKLDFEDDVIDNWERFCKEELE